MEISDRVRAYLRHVAAGYVEHLDESEQAEHDAEQEALWDQMDLAEQDLANDIVQAVFEEWL